MNAPGRSLLKISSLLLILVSIVSLIVSIVVLVTGGSVISSAISATGYAEIIGGIVIVAGILALAMTAFQLIAGILGFMNCNRPEKARPLFVMGMILLVLSLLSLFMGGNVWVNIIYVVLTGVYVYGAYLNKQAA